MINPLHAVVDLARTQLPTVASLMDINNIKYDLASVEVPPLTSHLIISSVVPFSQNYMARWEGDVRFTAFGRQPFIAQTLIEGVIADIWDPLQRWKLFRIASGKNAGAVITVDNIYNLERGQWPLSGDVYTPFWAVDVSLMISVEAMAVWS